MKETTFEEYQARCRAHGDSDEDIANTWELLESIRKILDDEDLDPYTAPEVQQPQKVRLARMFIGRVQQEIRDGDKAIVSWLRSLKVEQADQISALVARGEHWAWYR